MALAKTRPTAPIPLRLIAIMASALKAWSVKQENGLKDFIKVCVLYSFDPSHPSHEIHPQTTILIASRQTAITLPSSQAQCQIAVVLAFAHFGNIYEPSYPRNDNHSPPTFWLVNAFLAVGAFFTWTWKASSAGRSGGSPRVIILGREQTEEWKGWMQVSIDVEEVTRNFIDKPHTCRVLIIILFFCLLQ
jgi:hypothetical protein